jgi:hypothetical protein
MSAAVAFTVVAAAHAGFQVTVTALVYPVLASRTAPEWSGAHDRHTRAITPLVVVVYGALLVTGALLVAAGPDPAGWVALAAETVAVGVTAFGAGPLHGRMTERDEDDVARLLVLDRWRCAGALVGLAAAVVSLATA